MRTFQKLFFKMLVNKEKRKRKKSEPQNFKKLYLSCKTWKKRTRNFQYCRRSVIAKFKVTGRAARIQWNNIGIQGKNCDLTFLYTLKILFGSKDEMMKWTHFKQNLELTIRRHLVKEILKNILQFSRRSEKGQTRKKTGIRKYVDGPKHWLWNIYGS